MAARYRLRWTRTDTNESGLFDDSFSTLANAQAWATNWTDTLANLDPHGETPIVVTVVKPARKS